MTKKKQNILLFFLLIFSIYCAITIGQSWDEKFHLLQGKITLDYLFSLGNIDSKIQYRENYSTIYWSLLYFITKIFPHEYQIEISHLVNLIFSIGTIFGIGKINRELFNKNVEKIIFIIFFFYPIFFGHIAFNSKDTILAFSHVWITCLVIKYLKYQTKKIKVNNYIFLIGILAAIATGIQLVFLGSLIPIILFIIIDIFIFKKIITKKFNIKKFFYDFLKCFIIFYLLLIIFWIDVHANIIFLPYNIILETFSSDYWTGWPFNVVNGNYFLSNDASKFYLLMNFLFKSPEYFLGLYLFFIVTFYSIKVFFNKSFKFFYYKLLFIISLLIFPNLILFFIPYPLYDGMRLFLWTLPYYSIIPSLSVYYLIENFHYLKQRLVFSFFSIFFIYFLYNFFIITPYHYTYLNLLNGKIENRYKKFENDYWGASIKELIKKSYFLNNKTLMIANCGVNADVAKEYFKEKGYINLIFVEHNKADFIIMTNRSSLVNSKKITNCFDKFKGVDIFKVERNGLVLSVIRKI